MNNKEPQFESIKMRLRKLQALAERGYRGEAENAKRLLEKLCKKYGVTLEDVLDQEKTSRYRFKVGRAKIWLDLFIQCFANVTGQKELRYRQATNSEIVVELTAYHYAEIANLFYWHKSNLKKDIEQSQRLVFEAYVRKHHICRDRSNDPEDEEDDKPIDFEHLHAVMAMMRTLNDNTYHKMIESK